jgi:hypothetical protein
MRVVLVMMKILLLCLDDEDDELSEEQMHVIERPRCPRAMSLKVSLYLKVWGDCSCIQVCIVPAIGVGASFSFLLSQGKY